MVFDNPHEQLQEWIDALLLTKNFDNPKEQEDIIELVIDALQGTATELKDRLERMRETT